MGFFTKPLKQKEYPTIRHTLNPELQRKQPTQIVPEPKLDDLLEKLINTCRKKNNAMCVAMAAGLKKELELMEGGEDYG